MGNLLFQLKAAGEIDTLEEGRAICAKASDLYELEPEDAEAWDAAYEHFLKVVG